MKLRGCLLLIPCWVLQAQVAGVQIPSASRYVKPFIQVTWPEFGDQEVKARDGRAVHSPRRVPSMVVEVIGRNERPLDRYLSDVLPRLGLQLQQAFRTGTASGEGVQILSQFMASEPGRFIAMPASVWYNGTMPESLRWEGMWGLDTGTFAVHATSGSVGKTQTMMNRGHQR